MFGKLIKHEFRATGRVAVPLCGVMLALAVIAGGVLRFWSNIGRSRWGETAGSMILVLFGMSIFAVAIGIFIILMQHFKRNMLGDEAYLTRTLPVSLHELLLSKLFVAVIWYIVAGILTVFSVMVAGTLTTEIHLGDLGDFLDALRRFLADDPTLLLRAILGWLGGMAFLTLLFYADFTLSQSFSKHKVLYNVAGVVIMLVLLRLVFGVNDLFYTVRSSAGVIGGADGPTQIYVTSAFPVELVEIYVFDVLLYFLTWGFLTKRPNLE